MIVAAELRSRGEVDVWHAYFRRRLEQIAAMFDGAIARGELAPNVDREAIITLAAGPIYFRTFISGRPVDEDFIQSIVGSVCWLYCAPSAAAKASIPARIS